MLLVLGSFGVYAASVLFNLHYRKENGIIDEFMRGVYERKLS